MPPESPQYVSTLVCNISERDLFAGSEASAALINPVIFMIFTAGCGGL